MNDHIGHLRKVLIILRDYHLFANLEKCTFCKENVVCQSFKVGKDGVHLYPKKIKFIQE